MAEVQVRFRHTGGDVGPFRFPASSNVQDMRETLFQEWPKDGILGKDYPASPGEVRIILNGRFLEAGESLQELRSAMGSPKPGALVTMHVVLRPASSMKSTASKTRNLSKQLEDQQQMSGRVAQRQLEALLEPLEEQHYETIGPQHQPAAKKTPIVSQVLSKKALKKQQKQQLKQKQHLNRKAEAARTALERNLAFIKQTQRAEAARASLMQKALEELPSAK